MKRLLFLFASLSVVLQPVAVSAQLLVDSRGFSIDAGFDPNNIITDQDMFDVTRMSKSRLLAFMDTKGSLADVQVKDIDGVMKSTAEVIWRVANSYQVNPQYLLALLQKEQSLVENDTPASQRALDWATGYGVCDDCSKDDPAIQNFKGFANQVEYAAKQFREKNLLRLLGGGQTLSGMAVGKTTVVDGITVTPVNNATASLYTYTPHIHGNLNLWRIWKRWFAKNYPDGTVVIGQPSGDIWWIRNGVKRPFDSALVASTLVDLTKAVKASDTELASYEDGEAINFPNYSLLRDPSGKIWLIVDQSRRRIVNMETFRKFGFNMDEVEQVTDADLAPYEIDDAITMDTKYPQGSLLQDSKTKEVWYAENGAKQLIESPAILALYFKKRTPKKVTTEALAELRNDGLYKLHDGELLKSSDSPAVYVLENGTRRPILSGEVFEELGWNWKNVATLPESVLSEYSIGIPVTTDAPTVQLAQK
jgi:hypothetical protein